jgi:hypothetical protein
MGRGTSRSTTTGQASHPALWAVIGPFVGLPTFGGGKPRLSGTFDICGCCSDHKPQRRGSPRCAVIVVLLVPATSQIRDDVPLRGGLPAPNGEQPPTRRSQPRERGGLPAPSPWIATSLSPSVVDRDVALPHSPWIATSLSPSVVDRDVALPIRRGSRRRASHSPWIATSLSPSVVDRDVAMNWGGVTAPRSTQTPALAPASPRGLPPAGRGCWRARPPLRARR